MKCSFFKHNCSKHIEPPKLIKFRQIITKITASSRKNHRIKSNLKKSQKFNELEQVLNNYRIVGRNCFEFQRMEALERCKSWNPIQKK